MSPGISEQKAHLATDIILIESNSCVNDTDINEMFQITRGRLKQKQRERKLLEMCIPLQ